MKYWDWLLLIFGAIIFAATVAMVIFNEFIL